MTVLDGKPLKEDKPGPVAKKPTRQAQLRKLLTRKSRASIAHIQKAFGWQPHTAQTSTVNHSTELSLAQGVKFDI